MEPLAQGTEIDAGGLCAPDAEPGSPFVIGAALGEFAHGSRYRARQDNVPVLLTVVDPVLVADSGAMPRLTRDLQTAAKVSHRNLLPLYGAERAGGRFLIVEADPSGTTVRDFAHERAQRGRQIDGETAYTLLAHLCNALATMHDTMIHGYVTADTVLVSGTGRVFLSSTGIGAVLPKARSFARFQQAGLLPNIAPEQLLSPPALCPGTDVFGLATLFIELVLGVPLLEAGLPLTEVGLYGPIDLIECLERATAPSASARPPDVTAFKAELAEAVKSGAVERSADAGMGVAMPSGHPEAGAPGMPADYGHSMPIEAHPPPGYPPGYGYPQYGYPPQGYPPQAYPPQAYPPHGYGPEGYPPQAYPPQYGYPPQGYPPQGYPPQGYPPQYGGHYGYPPQGYPPHPPQGYPGPEGPVPSGPEMPMQGESPPPPQSRPGPPPPPPGKKKAAPAFDLSALDRLDAAIGKITSAPSGDALSFTSLVDGAEDEEPAPPRAEPPPAPSAKKKLSSAPVRNAVGDDDSMLNLDLESTDATASRLQTIDGAPGLDDDEEEALEHQDADGSMFDNFGPASGEEVVSAEPSAPSPPPTSRGEVWLWVHGDGEDGPFDTETLIELVREGELGAADLLQHRITKKETVASSIPELREALMARTKAPSKKPVDAAEPVLQLDRPPAPAATPAISPHPHRSPSPVSPPSRSWGTIALIIVSLVGFGVVGWAML